MYVYVKIYVVLHLLNISSCFKKCRQGRALSCSFPCLVLFIIFTIKFKHFRVLLIAPVVWSLLMEFIHHSLQSEWHSLHLGRENIASRPLKIIAISIIFVEISN